MWQLKGAIALEYAARSAKLAGTISDEYRYTVRCKARGHDVPSSLQPIYECPY